MIKKQFLEAVFITFFSLVCLAFGHARQDDNAKLHSEENVLRIGYPAQAFSKGYLEDVRIALEVWGEQIAKKYDKTMNIEVSIFEDFNTMQRSVLKGEVDLLIMGSLEYLILEQCPFMEPVTAEKTGGNVCQEFILLIRKDTGLDSLNKLEGREILIDNRAVGDIPEMWLDILLSKDGLDDKESHFGGVKIVEGSSKAVLPVYFKQADACIIIQRAFDTLCELNPQLRQDLEIIHRSPPYLRGLSLLNNNLDQEIRENTLDALFTMKEEPEGRQIYLILQIEEVVPFKPEYLDTIRVLQEEHQMLMPSSSAGKGRKGKNR